MIIDVYTCITYDF